jgi:hypothetical protein
LQEKCHTQLQALHRHQAGLLTPPSTPQSQKNKKTLNNRKSTGTFASNGDVYTSLGLPLPMTLPKGLQRAMDDSNVQATATANTSTNRSRSGGSSIGDDGRSSDNFSAGQCTWVLSDTSTLHPWLIFV